MLRERIIVQHHFVNITQALEEQLLSRIWWHFENWSDTYLRTFLSKETAEIKLVVSMEKNKQDKYEATFSFYLDSDKPFVYTTDVPFKEPIDVVNHAFLHLKEHLADQKD